MESTPAMYKMRINFALLRKQKQTLLDIIDDPKLTLDQQKDLEGILNLLDHIQDFAVDNLSMSDRDVFGSDLPQLGQ